MTGYHALHYIYRSIYLSVYLFCLSIISIYRPIYLLSIHLHLSTRHLPSSTRTAAIPVTSCASACDAPASAATAASAAFSAWPSAAFTALASAAIASSLRQRMPRSSTSIPSAAASPPATSSVS